MRLFDSNLLIYAAQDKFAFLRVLISDEETVLSIVSKVETLGYPKLTVDERRYFDSIFKADSILPITDEIVDKAIELRQQKRMSLGDCLIAATALVNGFDLYHQQRCRFQPHRRADGHQSAC